MGSKHKENVLPDCVCVLFSLVLMQNLDIAGSGRCDDESFAGSVVSWGPLWEGRPRGGIFCEFFFMGGRRQAAELSEHNQARQYFA